MWLYSTCLIDVVFFFHQTLVTSKHLNLETFDMPNDFGVSIFKVMLANFSFYYIF